MIDKELKGTDKVRDLMYEELLWLTGTASIRLSAQIKRGTYQTKTQDDVPYTEEEMNKLKEELEFLRLGYKYFGKAYNLCYDLPDDDDED